MHPPKYLESKRVKQSCINRKNLGVNLYPVNFLRSPFSYLSILLLLWKTELLVKYWASTQLRPPDILLHIWMNQWPPVFPPIIYQHLSKTDLGCIHDQNTRELGHLDNIWVDPGSSFQKVCVMSIFSNIFMVFLPSYSPFWQISKKYFFDLHVRFDQCLLQQACLIYIWSPWQTIFEF